MTAERVYGLQLPEPGVDARDMQWSAKHVREGRKLVAAEGDLRWQLGDLALDVFPTGEPGAHNGSHEQLDEFADEIGAEGDTLRTYRSMAAAWPPGTRVPGVSWSVHRLLRARDDRKDLLDRLVERFGAGVTVSAARRATLAADPLLDALETLVARWDELDESETVLSRDEQLWVYDAILHVVLKAKAIVPERDSQLDYLREHDLTPRPPPKPVDPDADPFD